MQKNKGAVSNTQTGETGKDFYIEQKISSYASRIDAELLRNGKEEAAHDNAEIDDSVVVGVGVASGEPHHLRRKGHAESGNQPEENTQQKKKPLMHWKVSIPCSNLIMNLEGITALIALYSPSSMNT